MGTGQGGPGLDVRYRVEVRPAALKALRKIDPADARRVQGAIALLALDPRVLARSRAGRASGYA